MTTQNIIIYKFNVLYHILEELGLDLNIKVTFAGTEDSLNECLKNLNIANPKNTFYWPKINKKILITDKINFVIQINGKTRDIISIEMDTKEDDIKNIILNPEVTQEMFAFPATPTSTEGGK